MLKFFRKIRQQLISENRTAKYLLYAAGEILLVMIGILLALQINNWNQNQQDRKVEEIILLNLRDALKSDLENTIKENLNTSNSKISLTNALIDTAEKATSRPDNLKLDFQAMGLRLKFRPSKTAYKILESKGLEIIQNEVLKFAIIDLYDLDYALIIDRFENDDFNLRDIYRPQIRKYFVISPRPVEVRKAFDFKFHSNNPRFVPVNYADMLGDREFMNTIAVMNSNSIEIKRLLEELIVKLNKLIAQIEEELTKF